MEIRGCGSQPSMKGQGDYFTGIVSIDPLFTQAQAPSRVTTALVTFEPGARNGVVYSPLWRIPPLGQTIVVLSGCGRARREAGPLEETRAGDVVRFAPGERRWRGASEKAAMSHVAVQKKLDDTAVAWQDKVTDEQFKS